MAIDSTVFMADIPAGEYKRGQVIPLTAKFGPAVVRDGYGTAKLKGIWTAYVDDTNTGFVAGHMQIQNSNWVDPVLSLMSAWSSISASEDNQAFNPGFDTILTPNSGWQVSLVVGRDVTTTADNTAFVIIDVDYPKVGAVANPRTEHGTPASTVTTIPLSLVAPGAGDGATFATINVDILKAGYRYAMQKTSLLSIPSSSGTIATGMGFLAFSGAAAMGGLQRIMPISTLFGVLRPPITYTSVITKGPMTIGCLIFGTGSGTNADLVIDWVKRGTN